MRYHRLLANVLLCLAVFMVPWWVVALIALVALIAFERFYEALIAGVIMDALFSMPTTASFPAWSFVFFAGSAIAFLLVELAKRRMRVFEYW